MITVNVDDRIRLVSAILALTVGNTEIQDWAYPHPLRLATQKFLEPFKSHTCTLMFDEICRRIPPGMPPGDIFYKVAILLTQPPRIEWDIDAYHSKGFRQELEELYGTVLQEKPYQTLILSFLEPILKGLEKLPFQLSDFFEISKISEFWLKHHRWWKEAVQQCSEIVSSWRISQRLRDFYRDTGGDLLLVPNLTDPPSDCFGPTRRSRKYAILGPPTVPINLEACDSDHQYGRKPQYLVNVTFYEFSHGFLKRHLDEVPEVIERTEYLTKRNNLKGWFPSAYPIWRVQFEEIFIRASTALFLAQRRGESEAEKFLEKQKEQHGIYVIDEFYERLWNYVEGKRDGKYTDLTEYLSFWSCSLRERSVS
jgi:hypothetical protein